jgi:hypothetical protein
MGKCSMTAVENKLMMILMRFALSDSASSGLSRPSATARQNSQREQDTKIVSMPSLDAPQTRRERANDSKPS